MDSNFWHERWNANQITFHQGRPNAMLERHFDALAVASGGRILVPLCGKAIDMTWLRQRGHDVVGVELSPVAVRDYFRDQQEPHTVSRRGEFEVVAADGIELLCGDFFATSTALLGSVPLAGAYDRAALVALPEDMRSAYAAHLLSLLDGAAPVLLVTFEYDQAQMQGPPFSIPQAEVKRLFEPARTVTLLEREQVLDRAPALAKRGLTQLAEVAYLIS